MRRNLWKNYDEWVMRARSKENPRVAVVIPTLDRPALLSNLISNIEKQALLPTIVVIVDSSLHRFQFGKSSSFPLVILDSQERSAAVQRNVGIRYLLHHADFDYCAFLDDDIEFGEDYLRNLVDTLDSFGGVGISGIAIGANENYRRRNFVLDLVGLTGKEGLLTSAAVNIPVRSGDTPRSVDWLIGCSMYRREVVKKCEFEKDFPGSSIFEDVIYSVRASKLGTIIVDPRILIKHQLSEINRPGTYDYYFQWAKNRIRLYKVARDKISIPKYFLVNSLMAFGHLIIRGNIQAFAGIYSGMFRGFGSL